MAGNLNLSRNTKVYYTIVQGTAGFNDANTAEIQVLGGYSFSQGTEQQTIQINEAGVTPTRGQRSFNTKLNPVDWKFSTYVRPKKNTYTTAATMSAATTISLITVNGVVTHSEITATYSSGTTIPTSGMLCTISGMTGNTGFNSTVPIRVSKVGTVYNWCGAATNTTSATTGGAVITPVAHVVCPEAPLWNALVAASNQWQAAYAAPFVYGTASSILQPTASEVHQLAPFSLIFKIDNTYYKVAGCALSMAEVNFGIDQIAQVSWTGYGRSYATYESTTTLATEIGSLTGADTTANFITNKLSTVSLALGGRGATGTDGLTTAGTQYSLPITGGTITFNNNLVYLTPEILGTVNTPIGYFTGTRAASGNLTAYLRTGNATETGGLLNAIIAAAGTATDNIYSMIINMGGQSNATRVEFAFNGAMLQVPAVDVQDVVSTTINFTGQGATGVYGSTAAYDISSPTEFQVTYKSA